MSQYEQPPPGYEVPPAAPEPQRDWLPIVLAALALVVAAGAIVVALIAVTESEEVRVLPSEASVGTDELQDGAVTEAKLAEASVVATKLALGAVGTEALAEGAVDTDTLADEAVRRAKLRDGVIVESKLAEEAVTEAKLAEEAVTEAKLAADAVTGAKVLDESLTGDDIDESTLAIVPAAETAETAERATVAESLEGFDPSIGALELQVVEAASETDAAESKGPVRASCPGDTQVVSGGAAIVTEDDELVPVALTSSTLSPEASWSATAQAYTENDVAWRLEVVAICRSLPSGS